MVTFTEFPREIRRMVYYAVARSLDTTLTPGSFREHIIQPGTADIKVKTHYTIFLGVQRDSTGTLSNLPFMVSKIISREFIATTHKTVGFSFSRPDDLKAFKGALNIVFPRSQDSQRKAGLEELPFPLSARLSLGSKFAGRPICFDNSARDYMEECFIDEDTAVAQNYTIPADEVMDKWAMCLYPHRFTWSRLYIDMPSSWYPVEFMMDQLVFVTILPLGSTSCRALGVAVLQR